MVQQNESHNHPAQRPSRPSSGAYGASRRSSHTRHVSHSSHVGRSARSEVFNARDELERERQMYSAHDPRQNAPSPAQRYAQAHKDKEQKGAVHQGYRNQGVPDDMTSADPARISPTLHMGESALNGHISRQRISSEEAQERYQGADSRILPDNGQISYQRSIREGGHAFDRHVSGKSGRMPAQRAPQANGAAPLNRPVQEKSDSALYQKTPSTTEEPKHQNEANRYQETYGRAGYAGSQKASKRRPSVREQQQNHAFYTRKHHGIGPQTEATESTDNPSEFIAENYLSANRPRRKMSKGLRMKLVGGVVAVVVVAVGVFGFSLWDSNRAIAVTLNGQEQTVSGQQRSLQGLIDTNTVSVSPGNYVAVDGSVIRQGEGTRATVTVNGQPEEDLSLRFKEGDDISIADGADITEEYTESNEQDLQPSVETQGVGAVHVFTQQPEVGKKVLRTGKESGKTAEVTTKEPVNGIMQYYNVNSNGDKVVALTFDDGPWDSSTQAILDILKENDAKATFFTVGQVIKGHEDLVKRAVDEGNEVGTHTWDHAEGSGQGVSLILMSSDERKQEVEKGMQAIKDATGQDASRMFRAPGGNFNKSVASDLSGMIDAEIGWNIDTEDWKRPGVDAIVQRIEKASPGEILLMHDGGGDRSQTVEALRQALPVLKDQGYRFVTVSELINTYPYQG